MNLKLFALTVAVLAMPMTAFAVSTNSQGVNSASSSQSSASSTSGAANLDASSSNLDSNGNSTQTQAQTQTQTQTSNASAGTQTQTQAQTQTEAQVQIQDKIKETAPKYAPANGKAAEHKSVVANAVQSLIQTSYQLENSGIGDQIRFIAQVQTQNQDKIGQAIDKADKRSSFAKFFIGANYKELTEAKTAMEQNRTQIQELEKLMTQIDNEGNKLEIANQIIVLQNQQIELREQLNDETQGFSLFGWLARWKNNW